MFISSSCIEEYPLVLPYYFLGILIPMFYWQDAVDRKRTTVQGAMCDKVRPSSWLCGAIRDNDRVLWKATTPACNGSSRMKQLSNSKPPC